MHDYILKAFERKQAGVLARIDDEGVYHSPNVCFATEGPIIRDGAQTTAGSDFSGVTVTTYGGFQSSGQYLAVKVNASRTVALCSSAADLVYGILQNKPAAGQAADVAIAGVTKAMAGAAITADAAVMVNASGQLITRTTASGYCQVGIALEAANGAGDLFTMRLMIIPVLT